MTEMLSTAALELAQSTVSKHLALLAATGSAVASRPVCGLDAGQR